MLFEDPVVGPPDNVDFSTAAITLPAGSDWTHVVFPIAASDLRADLGSVDAALTNATVMRIFHSTALDFPGETIVSPIGVDNIRAVPERGAAMLVASGISGLALARRRA